jgi:hypothetical protein
VNAGWDDGVANLASRVRDLDETLDAVVGELPAIAEAVARVDGEVARLQSERVETGAALSRHDQQLRELTAAVKRLSTQVTWIERHIRSTGAARSVSLDQRDPELASLAATSEVGRRAGQELLAPFARSTIEGTMRSHRDAVTQQRSSGQDLLQACTRLVDSKIGEPVHREARAAYQRSRAALLVAERQVASLEAEAETGRVRLAEDDDARRRNQATISAGERAEAQLLTRLRTKLAAAVGDGALLPAWLTTPLGPMPSADSAQRWMEVATGLIAYRITYGVVDDENTLGELPRNASPHRRRWYEDLRRGVRELRR